MHVLCGSINCVFVLDEAFIIIQTNRRYMACSKLCQIKKILTSRESFLFEKFIMKFEMILRSFWVRKNIQLKQANIQQLSLIVQRYTQMACTKVMFKLLLVVGLKGVVLVLYSQTPSTQIKQSFKLKLCLHHLPFSF